MFWKHTQLGEIGPINTVFADVFFKEQILKKKKKSTLSKALFFQTEKIFKKLLIHAL